MSGDLTRWNRAGLRRVRYVDGGAADFLESLRAALADPRRGPALPSSARFPDWAALQVDPDQIEREAEDRGGRRDRLLRQYDAARRDYGWEIARAFARASHVLGEHIDAFANEGYLETATQWDLLRRLVEMLGYAPAPPASASTPLVLLAKPGSRGVLGAGLQIRHAPPGGDAPVVFETLQALEVDAALNLLRPARWDRSEEPFDPFAAVDAAAGPAWQRQPEMRLSVGQPAIVWQAAALPAPGHAVAEVVRSTTITALDADSGALAVAASGGDAPTFLRGYTRLLAGPARTLRPRLNGPQVLLLQEAHGLGAGDVVAWRSGAWQFARVVSSAGLAVLLDRAPPPVGSALYRAARVAPVVDAAHHVTEFRLPLRLEALAPDFGDGRPLAVAPANYLQPHRAAQATEDDYQQLVDPQSAPRGLWLLPAGGTPVAHRQADDATGACVIDGAPAGLASGDWLVAELRREAGGPLLDCAARVLRIDTREADFTLWLALADPSLATAGAGATQNLLTQLRRLEAVLDQAVFGRTSLAAILSGALAAQPVSIIAGIGAPGGHPPSHADKLAQVAVTTVEQLAHWPAGRPVAGMGEAQLRVLQTHARQLVGLPAELPAAAPELAPLTLAQLIGSLPAVLPASPGDAPPIVERLHGPMRHVLQAAGHARNPLDLPDLAALTLDITPAQAPPALQAGRMLVIEQEGGDGAHQTQVKALRPGPTGALELVLAEPLPTGAGYRLGNTLVRANAVRAGHGEAKGERLLGSGNAALLNQEFVFDTVGVASVADPTMRSGVRPDIVVSVGGQMWQAVESLADSRATDPHFTVRMTEGGALRIGFGDGRHGRRLPSGTNNLRVRCRVGVGLAGNLPAGSLVQLVKPDRLVAAVRQPLAALGGNDLEPVDDIRINAPASVLTLERTVSLQDYANLASSQSGVWQAQSRRLAARRGRHALIAVTIVPANGAPLDLDLRPQVPPDFLGAQREFLLRHAPEGVDILVRPYLPVLVDFDVRVAVDSARFERAAVVDRVAAALREAFSLRQRRLGQTLQLGELYKVVEDVAGVVYSNCSIAFSASRPGAQLPPLRPRVLGGAQTTLQPLPGQVIYLDPRYSSLVVVALEAEL